MHLILIPHLGHLRRAPMGIPPPGRSGLVLIIPLVGSEGRLATVELSRNVPKPDPPDQSWFANVSAKYTVSDSKLRITGCGRVIPPLNGVRVHVRTKS